MQARILVVDDDALIRDFFETILTKRGYEVKTADDGQAAVELIGAEPFDLVLTDVYMPRMDGLALLRHLLGHHPLTPVVMLTAYATVENAVEAMKTGAFDYIAKPVTDLPRFDVTISRAIQHRALLVENQQLRTALAGGSTFEQIIGPGAKMQKVFKLISSVASSAANVLVTGPSGAGKELVARAIHSKSPRASGPFISINCAAVPEGLIESELFGHQKGAFTTAYQSKKGKFEQADNGTLLLDEIGDMPQNLQAKLLRVIETREFERVGGTESIKVDVRLVATTNVNLEKQ